MRLMVSQFSKCCFPCCVCAFQEVPRWPCKTFGYAEIIKSCESSDVCILIPSVIRAAVGMTDGGVYWQAVVIADFIFYSVQFIEPNSATNDSTSLMIDQILQFHSRALRYVSSRFNVDEPKIFLGIDANTTIAPQVDNLSGDFVAPRLRHHNLVSQQLLSRLLTGLGTVASSTMQVTDASKIQWIRKERNVTSQID